MKKILILVLSLVIITGCDIEYSLEIDQKSGFNETMNIDASTSFYEEDIPDNWEKIVQKYNGIINQDEENTNVKLNKSFSNILELKDEEFKMDYYKIKITEGRKIKITVNPRQDMINLLVGDDFKPAFIDSLSLKINLPLKNVKSNATSVNGDEHLWQIGAENIRETIVIEFDNPNYISLLLKNVIIVSSSLLIVGIIIWRIAINTKKVNEI